jgi:hypothetical protein
MTPEQEIKEEIEGTLREGIFASRWAEIETYHKIGRLILETGIEGNIPDYVKSNAVKLYKKYPIPTEDLISYIPGGKNISLKKILNEDKNTKRR